MMNRRKMLGNILFFIAIFSLTIYYIFHDQNIGSLIETVKQTKSGYWLIAVLCVIIFICSESVIIFYMMKSIGQEVHMPHCILYSFVGFFFSCITPSATGGQPAQIYFMKKDKIPITLSTLVLMIITITYKMVLIVLGAFVLLIRPAEIIRYLKPVIGICYIGLFINVVFVGFLLLLVFNPTLAKNILVFFIEWLGKLKIIRVFINFYTCFWQCNPACHGSKQGLKFLY